MAIYDNPWDYFFAARPAVQGLSPEAEEQRRQMLRPIPAPEREGFLRRAVGAGTSGLAWAGETLDKAFGGRALRAALQGVSGGPMKWGELASVVPFSDTLGLTDPGEAVKGEDLAKQWGVLEGEGTKGTLEWRDLVGPALEMGLDPGTYLTFGLGAANRAGRQAAKLGVLPKTTAGRIRGFSSAADIADKLGRTLPEAQAAAQKLGMNLDDLIQRPLGGVFGLRVPGFNAAEKRIFGTGARGETFARAVGAPFQWLGQTRPALYLKSAFNPTYHGQPYASTQKALAETEPFALARTEDARRAVAESVDPLAQLHAQGRLPADYRDYVADIAENIRPQDRVTAQAFAGLDPDVQAALTEAAGRLNAVTNAQLATEQASGLQISRLASIFPKHYLPNTPTPVEAAEGVLRGRGPREHLTREFYAGLAPAITRKPVLDLPGGQTQVNRFVKDPLIGTRAREPLSPKGVPIKAELDPAVKAALEADLRRAFAAFTPAMHRQYLGFQQAIQDAKALGQPNPLSPQDLLDFALLKRDYAASRKQIQQSLNQNVLDFDRPAYMAAKRQYEQLKRSTAPLTVRAQLAARQQMSPQLRDTLRVGKALEGEARFLSGRMRRMYAERLTGGYADPASELLAGVNRTRQDLAAARVLRERFGVDPDLVAGLRESAGLTPAELRTIIRDRGDRRLDAIAAMTTPSKSNPALSQMAETAMVQGRQFGPGEGRVLTPDEARQMIEGAHLEAITDPLARWLGRLDPRRQPVGFFANDPSADVLRRTEQGIGAAQRAEAVRNVLARHVATNVADPGAVPVVDLLKKLRLNTAAMRDELRRVMLTQGRALGHKDVSKLGVTADIGQALMAMVPRGRTPEYANPFLDLFNRATDVTRRAFTIPWPGFHTRNLTAAQTNNLMRSGPGALGWWNTVNAQRAGEAPESLLTLPFIRQLSAERVAQGGVPLTAEEAARKVGIEAFATRAFGPGMGRVPATAENLGTAERALMPQIPGMIPAPGFKGIVRGKTLPPESYVNPLGILSGSRGNPFGFFGENFAGNVLGRQVSDAVEDVSRGGQWLDLMAKGYSPSSAADVARQTHYDYLYGSAPFERDFMRKLFPFWAFTRNAVPQQLANLAQYPGGLAGQGIRLSSALRGQDQYLPAYLGNGLAIPVGGEADGQQRFLTKLDLPWEQPFDLFSAGPGGVAQTGMRLLGQLNPLLKGPLELATNRQFYSGRELSDVYPGMTGVSLIDNLIYNSPLARVATTARTLNDVRKAPFVRGLNVLTGLRLSDIDMARERQRGMLDAVRQTLGNDPNILSFEKFAPRRDALGTLSPEQVMMMRMLRTLESEAAAEARRRAGGGR